MNPPSEDTGAVLTMERMGREGIVISVCYGPSPTGLSWSVTCLRDATGEEFSRPYAARSFSHAVWIAAQEAKKRGWIT